MPSKASVPPPGRASSDHAASFSLRIAKPGDIGFIVALERRPDYRPFINRDPPARHHAALRDPDRRYLLAEQDGRPVGYAILAGLASPNRSIQLLRTAVSSPGEGHGRRLCTAILAEVFDVLKAHRLNRDLFEGNDRAEALYRSLGFEVEGLLREAERRGRVYHSLKVMALLAADYRRRRAASRAGSREAAPSALILPRFTGEDAQW